VNALVKFLTAVLDRREAAAKAGSYCSGWRPRAERDESYRPHYPSAAWSTGCDGCAASWASDQGSDWTLRDVEVKRRIVEECRSGLSDAGTMPYGGASGLAGRVLRLLAIPDADQPGFREEWRL
jgi:hypothetical protein